MGFTNLGFDFSETISPVVKPAIVRVILTLALSHGWQIAQLDVNNAFLNGELKPQGLEDAGSSHKVYRLHKALYFMASSRHYELGLTLSMLLCAPLASRTPSLASLYSSREMAKILCTSWCMWTIFS